MQLWHLPLQLWMHEELLGLWTHMSYVLPVKTNQNTLGPLNNTWKSGPTNTVTTLDTWSRAAKKIRFFCQPFCSTFQQGRQRVTKWSPKTLEVEILWQGKPISCMKSFGKNTCSLCMRERCCILDACNENQKKLINSKSEIFGACRHKTKFHRLARNKML